MTLTIERLGHLGDGIAPGPVYAPRTLPGEVIEGAQDGDRIAVPSIVTPSPDRVRPSCPQYRRCGGCALQHASDGFVADWKAGVVRAALAAQGLDAPIRGIVTSPPASRRRAVLSGRRTKSGALVGFHAPASPTVVDIPDCHLLRPELMALLPALGALVEIGGSRKGEMSFTLTASRAGADVAVTGGKPMEGPLQIDLARIGQEAGLARLNWDGAQVAQWSAPVQHFDGIAVTPSPGAFLQATLEGEVALRGAVTEALGNARRVVDLFAGAGTFALPLARQAEVHAVEGARGLVDTLQSGWRHAEGLKRVTTEARDLFRRPLMAAELSGFDGVVIDPPRAGAEAQTAELARAGVPVIAFVSCNPVTFARDAKTLVSAGYRLDWIDVVDQFRWSPHVELAARFTHNHMAG